MSRNCVAYLAECGEGGPGLEAILGGEARAWKQFPVPAVVQVTVEVCVTIVRVIRVMGHKPLLL